MWALCMQQYFTPGISFELTLLAVKDVSGGMLQELARLERAELTEVTPEALDQTVLLPPQS